MLNTKLQHGKATLPNSAFLLEEVLQLLHESLEQDPFSWRNHQTTKKHIARLRELLGNEFSCIFSETGSLFYAALAATYRHAHSVFAISTSAQENTMQFYISLLNTSYNIMSFGLHSEQTNRALLTLATFGNKDRSELQDIHGMIKQTLSSLQRHACEISVMQMNKIDNE